ncbi:MAG: hypothetical protein FWG06_00405 [Clostridiales bacterium]|nr:hypothetical protein [Clostridiales bacterium]
MAQRGRSKHNSGDKKGNIKGKGHVRKGERLIKNKPEVVSSPTWQGDDIYTSSAATDDAFAGNAFQAGRPYKTDNLPKEDREWQRVLPTKPVEEQTALVPLDLHPFYEALAEMRERICEAEKSLEHSRQAQQTLQQEMETATQLAQEAEEELASAAKKAAYLKHEAEQICSEGQTLQGQLNAEVQRWQQMLEDDQRLLTDTEQKLRIAEEEAQRIHHAKEVAARMNERELWRLGSSKQGLWLQRRKVQGNALPMTRDKSGSWHVPKVLSSPGATYAKNLLEQEQKRSQKLGNDPSRQRKKRLNMLSESAQALAERPSSQVEEEFLEKLAKQEAARHMAIQEDFLDACQRDSFEQEPALPPRPKEVLTAPTATPPSELRDDTKMSPHSLHYWEMPKETPPLPANTPSTETRDKPEAPRAWRHQEIAEEVPSTPTLQSASIATPEAPQLLRRQMPEHVTSTATPSVVIEPPPILSQLLNAEAPKILLRQEIPQEEPLTSAPSPDAAPFVKLKDLLRKVMPEQNVPSSSSASTPTPLAGLRELLFKEISEQGALYSPITPRLAGIKNSSDWGMQEGYGPNTNSSLRCFVAAVAQDTSKHAATEHDIANNTSQKPYSAALNEEVFQALRTQERAGQITKPYLPSVHAQPIIVEDRLRQETREYSVPEYAPPVDNELLQALRPKERQERATPPYKLPIYTPSINVKEEDVLPPQPAIGRSVPEYDPPGNDEPERVMPRQKTPGQMKPLTDDPLQMLAMQAAMETAATKPAVSGIEDNNLYAKSQEHLAAAAAEQSPTEQKPPEINEDDMRQLTRQAHLLAQQHLSRQQAVSPAAGSATITQRVAEETGGQDHLLKEQRIAEQAIAAAMAAAKKAAQSAMSISGQTNQQATRYSAEQLIADALSKASETSI